MPVGPMLPRLQVEWSAASSSSSSDSDGPWRADPAEPPAGSPGSGEQDGEIMPAGGGVEAAAAQGRAAFFEALVRANTETVIRVRRALHTAHETA